ncbi:hypothetical protein [Photobacterium profundum]|uniref:Uncharacterized protein n=1 Tax=Photobacterium profundum (strain SS9) TaxID=298386 RepID=Q6LHV6_PHOPR|nr:hypothetical protein [Photobacterium profundum]CAG23124.1 hypothetical protein PBPRB1253 [Photobacterium profundum SS9]
MQLDFIFTLEVQLIFGVMFLLMALTTVSFVSGEDPYPQTVLIVGIVLIILSAGAVMYIENMKSIAEGWVESKILSKQVLEDFDKNSNLFLFVFPFVTAAVGTNLITEVITRNFNLNRKLTLGAVISGTWETFKFLVGLVILPITIPVAFILLVIFSFNSVLRRWSPKLIYVIGRVSRRTQLIILKADIILRSKIEDKT